MLFGGQRRLSICWLVDVSGDGEKLVQRCQGSVNKPYHGGSESEELLPLLFFFFYCLSSLEPIYYSHDALRVGDISSSS